METDKHLEEKRNKGVRSDNVNVEILRKLRSRDSVYKKFFIVIKGKLFGV